MFPEKSTYTVMGNYRQILPHPRLLPYIRYYWILEAVYEKSTPERVIPFGAMQLCFYRGQVVCGTDRLDAGSLLCGQTTGYSDVFTEGNVRIVAVMFQPFGAKAFFHLPLQLLAEQKIKAGDLDDAALRELELRIAETDEADACVKLLDEFFLRRLLPLQEYNYVRLNKVMSVIRENGGNVSVRALAETACLSEKQFQRVFSECVGLNPKEYMRTVRFQYALSLLQEHPAEQLTRLAYDCGYYDLSHLIGEFKVFSGYTPKEFLSICMPHSDYFE